MRILYNNLVFDSTITTNTENPYYLFDTALNDTRLSRYARTINDTGEWIKFDFGSAKKVSYCAIINHNLTSSATVKLQGNATDVWTSPSVDETLTISDFIIKNFTESSLRYWRVTFDDATNPDGYIQIAKIYLGVYIEHGINRTQSISVNSNSTNQKSITGQLYGNKQITFKTVGFTLSSMDNDSRLEFQTFFETVDIVTPFILLVWENSLDIQPPVYCNLVEAYEPAREDVDGVLWTVSFNVEECK